MKRILSVIISALVVATAFSSCSKPKVSDSAEIQQSNTASLSEEGAAQATANAAEDTMLDENNVLIQVSEGHNEFELGKIDGRKYINESVGIALEGLDENWAEVPAKQIALIYDSGIDVETKKAYANNSEDGSTYNLYDVMYSNKDTYEVISVSLFSNTDESELENVLPDISQDALKGYTFKCKESYIDFAGSKAACRKITYKSDAVVKLPDMTEYDVYLMSKSKKQVVQVVAVSPDGDKSVEELLKLFRQI